MQVRNLTVSNWRNIENLVLNIPEAKLVALVGDNGSGKSNVLELLSAAFYHLGISPGIEIPRGNPADESHDYTITVAFEHDLEYYLDDSAKTRLASLSQPILWDKSFHLHSKNVAHVSGNINHQLGGVAQDESHNWFSHSFYERLRYNWRQEHKVQYVFLDSDRSFPQTIIQPATFAQDVERDLDRVAIEVAHRRSNTLYDEWLRYMAASEAQDAGRYHQQARAHHRGQGEAPDFTSFDRHASFAASVNELLPHLTFLYVDEKRHALVFDSAGAHLDFYQLSGGEREIVFLIGQIERFKLRNGFLLLDEPELHLNPSLLRRLLRYLRATMDEGQVWLATHSLEVIEEVGLDATFMLSRSEVTKKVTGSAPLTEDAAVATLSRALGAPGFSISRNRFIYIEGEREKGESARFQKILDIHASDLETRFIEGGGCREVVQKFATIRTLASEATQNIRVGGIVDCDFRSDQSIDHVKAIGNILVLGCHEIENLFLDPQTLNRLLSLHANSLGDAPSLVLKLADAYATRWVLGSASENNLEISRRIFAAKVLLDKFTWAEVSQDSTDFVSGLLAEMGLEDSREAQATLIAAVDAYKTIRTADDFWARCMGKEVSAAVARALGMKLSTFEGFITQIWHDYPEGRPKELLDLESYVLGI